MELQMSAAAGMTKENSKILTTILEDYHAMILPSGGPSGKARTFEEEAREILAQEVKSAFIVKQTNSLDSDKIKRNKNATILASKYLQEKESNKPRTRAKSSPSNLYPREER